MKLNISPALAPDEILEWNRFIDHSRYTHFSQKYAWGQFQKMNTAQTPHYVRGFRDNTMVLAGILYQRKFPLVSFSRFDLPCGPSANSIVDIGECLKELTQNFQSRSVEIIFSPRVPIEEESQLQPVLNELKFERDPEKNRFARYHDETVTIDLTQDLTAIFSEFRKSTKWEIHRQEKEPIEITIDNSEKSLNEFFVLYKKHSPKRGGFFKPECFFQQMHTTFLKDPQNGFVALGRYQGKVTSGAVFLRTAQQVWYTYGASSMEAEKIPTAHLMHWRVIEHAKKIGCVCYDFGGVIKDQNEKSPAHGVAVFKTGFSKSFVRYIPQYQKTYQPILSKVAQTFQRLRS